MGKSYCRIDFNDTFRLLFLLKSHWSFLLDFIFICCLPRPVAGLSFKSSVRSWVLGLPLSPAAFFLFLLTGLEASGLLLLLLRLLLPFLSFFELPNSLSFKSLNKTHFKIMEWIVMGKIFSYFTCKMNAISQCNLCHFLQTTKLSNLNKCIFFSVKGCLFTQGQKDKI